MRLSVRDVAEVFGVPESTVTGWVRNDGLPANRVAGEFRFHEMQLLEWASAREAIISDGLVRSLDDHGAASPSLAEALETGGILPRVAAPDKLSAVREIVKALVLPARFERQALETLLLSRPTLGCSLVGDGIAIPHPRFPLVLPQARPAMTLCCLQAPWTVPSERGPRQTIDTLFLLVSPTVYCHLSLVARLGAALHDLEFRDLVKRRRAHAHILRAAHRLQSRYQAGENETSAGVDRAR